MGGNRTHNLWLAAECHYYYATMVGTIQGDTPETGSEFSVENLEKVPTLNTLSVK